MTKIQTLIAEIRELGPDDLEQVLKEVLARIDRVRRAELTLDKFTGIGQGVWETDAQQYIDSLRKEDRA